MVRIVYVEASGEQHTVQAEPRVSLMQNAVNNSVPGILADCGGACACATCRVYVPEEWRARLLPPSEQEQSMLSYADDRRGGVRLACQVKVTEELEGLTVHLPETQYF